jgi:hypothetical protein
LNALSDPGGIIIPGTLYAFNNGYVQSTTIQTGKGYWIRANAAGTIGLTCGPIAPAKPAPQAAPISTASLIQDAAGSALTLFFGAKLGDPQQALIYSLPAVPPRGAFDARFVGDSRISAEDQATIHIQSSHYPVAIEASNLPADGSTSYTLTEYSQGREGASHILTNGVPIHVSSPEVSSLRLAKAQPSPIAFAFEQNSPNPFNPSTKINYQVPSASQVTIEVFNVLGEKVATLVDEVKDAGYYNIVWNGRNDNNAPVASGMYIYSMQADKFSSVKKMMFLK